MPRQVGSIGELLLISLPQLFHIWVGLDFIKGRRRVGKILLCTAFLGRCNERRPEISRNDTPAMELAEKYHVEMPIAQTVNAIVKEGMSASDALRTLMDRNRKNEMPQGYEKV